MIKMVINYRELASVWWLLGLGVLTGIFCQRLTPASTPFTALIGFTMFSVCLLYLVDCEYQDNKKKEMIE